MKILSPILVTMMLDLAACTGPAGPQGNQDNTGNTGNTGAKGSAGTGGHPTTVIVQP